jgi:demethylmenaquinone methyltransferase/2-methoxy-6-polyprenyl-1,4-benzoquinol methylase
MNYRVESVNPYDSERPKKEQISEMFDSIASKYDQLNGVLSLGIDGYWRREALGVLKKYPHNHILDVATGTGDFAILAQKILKPESITAIDISQGMIAVGEEKVREKGLEDVITFDRQDCANLTLNDNTFDAVTCSFGVRNFEDIDKSFQEILRVLKPRGVFMFIELTRPDNSPIKELYNTYTKHVMPFLSNLLATEQKAYDYLPSSIEAFPQGREMMLILKKNGFKRIRLRRLTLGITTLYIAEK